MIKDRVEINPKAELKILVVCGIHGNESQAVRDVFTFKRALKEKVKKGEYANSYIKAITFVVANHTGLIANEREYQDFSKSPTSDFNRSFPWKTKEKSKEEVVDYIKKEIDEHQVVIDIHNSPNCIPCVLVDWNGPKFDKICSILKNLPKDIFTPVLRYSGVDSLKNYTNSIGLKLGFTVELGGMGFPKVEQDAPQRIGSFIAWIADSYANIKDEPVLNPFNYEDTTRQLVTSTEGIIHWADENKTVYKKGEDICDIVAFNTSSIESIKAPYDCILVTKSDSYYKGSYQSFAEAQPIDNKFFKAWEA